MILTVTLNAAIDKRYVVEEFKVGEVNRVKNVHMCPEEKGSTCPSRQLLQVQRLWQQDLWEDMQVTISRLLSKTIM